MRPRGSYGEVTAALVRAAYSGPAPVRELAARACVGFDVADRKASVLVSRGDLVVVRAGRPRLLGVPEQAPPAREDLLRSFWDMASPQD
jgi:hypothetical protein